MKLVTVVGARPQFIKAAAVSREIARHSELCEVIIHTGQHYDAAMSDIFFAEMEIPNPDYQLDINALSHGAMTGRMLERIEEILLQEKPDYVLVYGDTNSTLAGALAAKKLQIKVIHVEAGLRSFNMAMPEEINRILTDRISDILCCPTDTAIANLQREGFTANATEDAAPVVAKTGDVMQDAALYYSAQSAARSQIISTLGLIDQPFALCTVHRAENTDSPERLASIIEALNQISKEMPLVLPLHPRTRKLLQTSAIQPSFTPIEPVGYFDMIELLKGAQVVLTDSGGLQKEAYFFETPCVTLRDETEWVELVDVGANLLAGAKQGDIVSVYKEMLDKKIDCSAGVYGGGQASKNIINLLTCLC
ncbi:MAG: UDP-N-acetylglucosamine 2-epimerase (non-hydrolyzing) [Desulfuromonadales bacterium]|nr:UDP-N-acetylglucosamine 2-epimerase (non-hydrolyzing) [Desulfuromonadales bacterium]